MINFCKMNNIFIRFADTMANWTLEHNTYLSCLLDDVTGTREMIKLRQDYCQIFDCITSCNKHNMRWHFTGSKAEGLDLAGSDEDYMFDFNNLEDIEVSESIQQLFKSSRAQKILLIPDDVYAGFALLKCFSSVSKVFDQSMRRIKNDLYLSSSAYLSSILPFRGSREVIKIQGPSLETWTEYEDINKSGTDHVLSLHCRFWPSNAMEWINRPRHYGWPSLYDRQDIVKFGSHLVPVGHPSSPMKEMQWRISFSIAERTLVWSFNHMQMQCYAVMKLILKEFIKVKSSDNTKDVLCSYFIKTFLLWQYEETDPSFWQIQNLRGCIMYLLREFQKCIQEGVLRHYFIPRFNLFEVKLTRNAQRELSQLFDIIIQSDMAIMAKCQSLAGVGTNFRDGKENIQSYVFQIQARQKFKNEETVITSLNRVLIYLDAQKRTLQIFRTKHISTIFDVLRADSLQTPLLPLVLRELCFHTARDQLRCFIQRNNHRYQGIRYMCKNVFGNDISASRLWCATFFLQNQNYSVALRLINHVVSAIPPFVLYCSDLRVISNTCTNMLYRDTFLTCGLDVMERSRKGWLFDITVSEADYQCVPRAIQIELIYRDIASIYISPFIYAYYLMFLCHQGLGQYDNRDRALRQLVYAAIDTERSGYYRHHSYNIAGHCLLVAGHVDMARTLFLKSVQFSKWAGHVWDKYNSANHYLSCM